MGMKKWLIKTQLSGFFGLGILEFNLGVFHAFLFITIRTARCCPYRVINHGLVTHSGLILH